MKIWKSFPKKTTCSYFLRENISPYLFLCFFRFHSIRKIEKFFFSQKVSISNSKENLKCDIMPQLINSQIYGDNIDICPKNQHIRVSSKCIKQYCFDSLTSDTTQCMRSFIGLQIHIQFGLP